MFTHNIHSRRHVGRVIQLMEQSSGCLARTHEPAHVTNVMSRELTFVKAVQSAFGAVENQVNGVESESIGDKSTNRAGRLEQ